MSRRRDKLQIVLARAIGSVCQLALAFSLAQIASVEVTGRSLVLLTWMQIASALVSWGHPVTVMRDVVTESHHGRRYTLKFRMRQILLIGVALVLTSAVVPTGYFSRVELLVIAAAATLQGVTRVVSQAVKSLGHGQRALTIEFALVPGAVAAAVGLTGLFDREVSTGLVITTAVLANLLALGLELLLWRSVRTEGGRLGPPAANRRPVTGLHKLGVLALLSIGAAHLPVAAAPAFLSERDVAAFAIAFRIASLATTVLTALTSYYGPRYARAYVAGDAQRVGKELRSSQLVSAGITLPMVLAIPVAGPVFELLGENYAAGATIYGVLVVGQFVNAATGVVSYVISMSHRERILLIINVSSLVALLVGWLMADALVSGNAMIYAAVYSAYLALRNIACLVVARHLVSTLAARTPDMQHANHTQPTESSLT